MLDAEGKLAEGSAENLFVVRDGRIYTNDERHSILLGITRDSVIRIARDLGYTVEVKSLTLEDLLSADEVFMTGTAVEITPVHEVDGVTIGMGRRGEVTEEIQQTFHAAITGQIPRYLDWLHFVDTDLPILNDDFEPSLALAG